MNPHLHRALAAARADDELVRAGERRVADDELMRAGERRVADDERRLPNDARTRASERPRPLHRPGLTQRELVLLSLLRRPDEAERSH